MKGIALLIGGSIAAAIGLAAFVAQPDLERAAAAKESIVAATSATRKVDVNTATVWELQKLPGIGPELAERVVQHRPYKKLDELIARKVLGRKQFARIKEWIRAGTLSARGAEQ